MFCSFNSGSGTSELFATCSEEDIRLWHKDKPKELLRITIPNTTCNSVDFMADGHSIISGESQGETSAGQPFNKGPVFASLCELWSDHNYTSSLAGVVCQRAKLF